MSRIETIILKCLVFDKEYARKVLPFIESDYFADKIERMVFEEISNYAVSYNDIPTKETILLSISKKNNLSDTEHKDIIDCISSDITKPEEDYKIEWLVDETESWCQERAIYNAVRSSIVILEDEKKKPSRGNIPKMLSDALSVCFDPHVGHDYVDDSEARFEYYKRKVDKHQFDLKYFNKITNGGIENKTLNVILAGTGAGKSLAMCHFASAYLKQGKNILYITLEMSEEKIAERIDSNLLNIDIDKLRDLPKPQFEKKMEKISQYKGRLIVKEYPTASGNVNHFRHLLNELELKRNLNLILFSWIILT